MPGAFFVKGSSWIMVFETFAKNKCAERRPFRPDSPQITRENVPVRILDWIFKRGDERRIRRPAHCKKTTFLWEKEIIQENKKVVPQTTARPTTNKL